MKGKILKNLETEITPEMVFERYSKEYGVYNWQEVELVLTDEPWLSFVYGCYISFATDRGGNRWLVKWGNTTDWRHKTPSYAELVEPRFYEYTEDFDI